MSTKITRDDYPGFVMVAIIVLLVVFGRGRGCSEPGDGIVPSGTTIDD